MPRMWLWHLLNCSSNAFPPTFLPPTPCLFCSPNPQLYYISRIKIPQVISKGPATYFARFSWEPASSCTSFFRNQVKVAVAVGMRVEILPPTGDGLNVCILKSSPSLEDVAHADDSPIWNNPRSWKSHCGYTCTSGLTELLTSPIWPTIHQTPFRKLCLHRHLTNPKTPWGYFQIGLCRGCEPITKEPF